jgi:hypothetical protein
MVGSVQAVHGLILILRFVKAPEQAGSIRTAALNLRANLLVDVEEQIGGDVKAEADQEAEQDEQNHQISLPVGRSSSNLLRTCQC